MDSSTLPTVFNPEQIIQTLQLELPTLFQKDISYSFYTSDILFKDPVNSFRGKFNYRIIFWTLRFHGFWFFSHLTFDLHRVVSISPEIIQADWTVKGRLRVPWKTQILFNGYSTYKLNEQGLIYEHIDTWDRSPMEILKQFFRVASNS